MNTQLLKGDCREQLRTIPDCTVDSIVTDPPYELGFMGKSWDSSGIAYNVTVWRECLRVLKPGGHLIAFGGSRTYHRLACAVEDAGFEIRDQLMWVYGSGFPKSLDVSKAIDKAAGAEREVVGSKIGQPGYHLNAHAGGEAFGHGIGSSTYETRLAASTVTAPATDDAKTWQGWGTALKPAHEPMVLARKPLGEKTVAENVLRWGTGALNINGTRIPSDDGFEKAWNKPVSTNISSTSQAFSVGTNKSHTVDLSMNKPIGGRWPANFIHDGSDEVLELFPETKPVTESAARFFYCAKASKSERNAGLNHLPTKTAGEATDRKDGSAGLNSPRAGAGRTNGAQNFHPTVKPVALMRYLIRLVTPPNGTVLDPFAGSGTTLVAAIHEQFDSIGIELTPDYWPIIEARTDHAKNNPELA